MFFTKRSPKSGTARLQQEMTVIADQCMANSKSMQSGRSLKLISYTKADALFTEKNEAGETVYNHYHFTEDMNQLDPEAQVHLMQLFGQIIAYNELLEHPGVERRLDWIIANASFFERLFARAEVSTDILMKRPSAEVERKMHSVVAADKARIEQVLHAMHAPDTIGSLVPRPTIPFMLALGHPYEDGQKFINGVYFSAQAAPEVMNWLASLQAQGMQDSNPAHA